jgi:hypothetical protein
MPARDFYHNAVKAALIKEGWIITADPYPLKRKESPLLQDGEYFKSSIMKILSYLLI